MDREAHGASIAEGLWVKSLYILILAAHFMSRAPCNVRQCYELIFEFADLARRTRLKGSAVC